MTRFVTTFLLQGCDVNMNAIGADGVTAFCNAWRRGLVDISKCVLDAGAKPDDDGWPLPLVCVSVASIHPWCVYYWPKVPIQTLSNGRIDRHKTLPLANACLPFITLGTVATAAVELSLPLVRSL